MGTPPWSLNFHSSPKPPPIMFPENLFAGKQTTFVFLICLCLFTLNTWHLASCKHSRRCIVVWCLASTHRTCSNIQTDHSYCRCLAAFELHHLCGHFDHVIHPFSVSICINQTFHLYIFGWQMAGLCSLFPSSPCHVSFRR